MIPAFLGFVVFGIMTIFFLFRLRRRILEQAKNARMIWATSIPSPDATD
jgi:hypothetical protein